MIILTWLLYIPALYLVYNLRVLCAGFGVFLDMIPTVLLHGAAFVGVYWLLRLFKQLLKIPNLLPGRQEKKNNSITIYGLVTVGFTAMYALNSYGFLSRAVGGYLIPICAYIVLAVSLNLVVGISGELSLGHAGFMGVGAFSGIVAAGCLQAAVPDPFLRLVLAMICGGLIAGVAGFIIGMPVLRLRGDYLTIVTLAFGEILKSMIENLYIGLDAAGIHFGMGTDSVHLEEGGKMLISGALGATGVKTISTFFAGFLLIVFTLAVVLNLVNSKEGRAIKAVRDNRIAAESVGINVTAFKLKAFVISAILAGMAGALFGLNFGSLQASKFSYTTSIDILVYVVLGGMGNILGSIISTVVLYLIPEFLRSLADFRMIMYAVVLIVVMLCTWSPKIKGVLAVVGDNVKNSVAKLFKKEVTGHEG